MNFLGPLPNQRQQLISGCTSLRLLSVVWRIKARRSINKSIAEADNVQKSLSFIFYTGIHLIFVNLAALMYMYLPDKRDIDDIERNFLRC